MESNGALIAAEVGNVSVLDLHGVLAREVPHRLDEFLHSAWMRGESSVRVVHGKGEGALLRAVLETVRNHELVLDYRVHETGGSTAIALTNRK